MNRQQRRAAGRQQSAKGFAQSKATPESVAHGIAIAAQNGQVGIVTLLRAVAVHRIALAALHDRTAAVTAAELAISSYPTVALVGDDDDMSTGPGGWRCAAPLSNWAKSAVVHAAGATEGSYQHAIVAAETHGNCALIETSSKHAAKWVELFAGKHVLLIRPDGGAHPLPRSAGMLQ